MQTPLNITITERGLNVSATRLGGDIATIPRVRIAGTSTQLLLQAADEYQNAIRQRSGSLVGVATGEVVVLNWDTVQPMGAYSSASSWTVDDGSHSAL